MHINSNMVNKDSNPDLYKKYVSGTKKYSFKIYGVETITPATSENPAVTTKSAPKTMSITITDKAPSVSFKKKGYISAFNSESQLTLIPVFKNIDEAVISEITISDKKDPLEDEGLFKVNVCDGNDCIINFTRYEECPNLDDYTSGTYSDEVAQEMKLYTKKYVNKKYKVYCTIKLNNCLTVNNTFDIKVEKRK